MLWVHGHYKYFQFYSAGIDYRRQILSTKVGPRTVRVKFPAAVAGAEQVDTAINLPDWHIFRSKLYKYRPKVFFIHLKLWVAVATHK